MYSQIMSCPFSSFIWGNSADQKQSQNCYWAWKVTISTNWMIFESGAQRKIFVNVKCLQLRFITKYATWSSISIVLPSPVNYATLFLIVQNCHLPERAFTRKIMTVRIGIQIQILIPTLIQILVPNKYCSK